MAGEAEKESCAKKKTYTRYLFVPLLEQLVRKCPLAREDLLLRLRVVGQRPVRPSLPPCLEVPLTEHLRLFARLEQVEIVRLPLSNVERLGRQVGVQGGEATVFGDGGVKGRSGDFAVDDVGPLDSRVLEDVQGRSRGRNGSALIAVQGGREEGWKDGPGEEGGKGS